MTDGLKKPFGAVTFIHSLGDKVMKYSLFRLFRQIRLLSGVSPSLAEKANFIFGNRMATTRVFVDVSTLYYKDHGGGIQRVQKALLSNFANTEIENLDLIPIYFCENEKKFKTFAEVQKYSLVSIGSKREEDVFFCVGDVYLNLDLNYNFYMENLPLLREFKQKGIHAFTMIYDLLPLSMPMVFPSHVPKLHTKWVKIAAEHTTPICISQSVKNELYEWSRGKLERDEIEVVELGWDIASDDSQDAIAFDSDRSLDFHFLVVSTIEPRKCHKKILQAFEILWDEGANISLTFVGQQGWDSEEVVREIVNHSRNGKNLFWFQNIPDPELKRLYQNSSALINASLGEGFGLPLREAIMNKLPLILRDIEVFREVAGNDAWFFVADSPKELSDTIRNWVKSYELGEIGVAQSTTFPAWKDTCYQIIQIIQKKLENS